MSIPDDDPSAAPPSLAAGSPAAPQGQSRPQIGASVFVDTSAAFERHYRLPLIISARLDLLNVYWSPYVAGEIARVATREATLATLRRLSAGQDAVSRVTESVQNVRRTIDAVVELLERCWSCPPADRLADATRQVVAAALPDENDRPILAGAVATEAAFLLSRDKEAFPHGRNFGGVAFWHPDTFLTTLFEDNPDAYQVVVDELRFVPLEASLFPRT